MSRHSRDNYFLIILVVVAIALLFIGKLLAQSKRIGPDSAYPPSFITGESDPKVTQATVAQTICVDHYTATVRAVTAATKKSILARDHATQPSEVDHFISLEIGGTNNPDKNLWAEPYAGKYGARVKDVVETADAQDCITSDWIACGQRLGMTK